MQNLGNVKKLECFFISYGQKLFLYRRFADLAKPLAPVTLKNPLRKRTRPPIRIESDSRIASKICVTIIGNGGLGQPRCLGLFTDFKSYFFNCGEGVGRYCREYDINMCMVKHIFVTQRKWHNMSGISDILLTNRTYGVSNIYLHGPPGIEYFESMIESEKKFSTEVHIKDPDKKFYIDHTLQVEYVPITSQNKTYITDRLGNKTKGYTDIAFSYVCKVFEKPGDFLYEKCVEYGVPPVGPEPLKLKNGENIVLSCGKTVYSEDVHTLPYPGTVMLVVDCPSEDFLDTFTSEKHFEKYQLPLNSSLEVSTVFHFTPSHIFSSTKYQDWICRFHQGTQHFVLNSENSITSSVKIHKTQKYFHMLHPEIFVPMKEAKPFSSFTSVTGNIFNPPPMLQLHIRPEKKCCWDNVVNPEEGIEEDGTESAKGSLDFYNKLQNLKSVLDQYPHDVNIPIYPEVVFLGTSSSTSSAYRNVTTIMVNTSPLQSIILDCGEGAMMQLTRYSGPSIYAQLRKISCIFVSHKHTDHYMGLFQLVSQRVNAFKTLGIPYEPLALVLPFQIENMFKKYCEIFEDISAAVRIYSCKYFHKKREYNLKQFLGDVELLTVPVMHCLDSHGVVLQEGSQWKLVYSGDASPSQKLVDAGKDCTILIHESSIEDGFVNEALAKKHSTPSQVIDMSERMNAKYTITTHFSKRYLALPVFSNSNERHIAHAFDFMKIRMCDWPVLPLFTPVMQSLFQEQLQEYAGKTSSVVNFEKTFLKISNRQRNPSKQPRWN